MSFKLSFGESKSSTDLSSSSALSTRRSKSVFDVAPSSTSSLHSSSIGTPELIRPRASKNKAIRIRKSVFRDSRRVGKRENDPRYYRFSLRRSGRVEISVQNLEVAGLLGFSVPTVKVRLERNNGKVLNRRTVEGGEFELISRKLDRDITYYIRISSSGNSVPYRLGLRTKGGAELFR
jgi:hypothetical protein